MSNKSKKIISSIKLKKIVIDRFRSIEQNSSFTIGDNITLIAGQNGTAKSTLLGMLSQPIGFPSRKKEDSLYTTAYHGVDLVKYKTINGHFFKADFSDIFKMSNDYDIPQIHKYYLFLDGDNIDNNSRIITDGLIVTSESRKDQENNKLRFVTNSDSRKPGEGNFPHPVIFLGLERLRPLVTCSRVSTNTCALNIEDKEYWEKQYRRIIYTAPNKSISTQEINTGNAKGKYQSIKTDSYDALGASAGQDNVGQILTALISFRKLKRELNEKYQGGVLLVDELDASLHPISQKVLYDILIESSLSLALQIIATTHSLSLLQYAIEDKEKFSKIIYLKKRNDKVQISEDVDFAYIQRDLAHIRNKVSNYTDKTTIILEDYIASYFFKYVTKNIFSAYIKIYTDKNTNKFMSIADNVLIRLSQLSIPEFKKIIYIVDPDSKEKIKIPRPNLISLPGDYAIEKMMYNFLSKYPDNNDIWDNILNCNQEECFINRNYFDNNTNILEYKKWFNSCLNKKYFGRQCGKLFNTWTSVHIIEAKKFSLDFLAALKRVNNSSAIKNYNELYKKIEKNFSA